MLLAQKDFINTRQVAGNEVKRWQPLAPHARWYSIEREVLVRLFEAKVTSLSLEVLSSVFETNRKWGMEDMLMNYAVLMVEDGLTIEDIHQQVKEIDRHAPTISLEAEESIIGMHEYYKCEHSLIVLLQSMQLLPTTKNPEFFYSLIDDIKEIIRLIQGKRTNALGKYQWYALEPAPEGSTGSIRVSPEYELLLKPHKQIAKGDKIKTFVLGKKGHSNVFVCRNSEIFLNELEKDIWRDMEEADMGKTITYLIRIASDYTQKQWSDTDDWEGFTEVSQD